VYSFGRAALLLLVEVQNHTVPVRERRRIRVKYNCEPSSSVIITHSHFSLYSSKHATIQRAII